MGEADDDDSAKPPTPPMGAEPQVSDAGTCGWSSMEHGLDPYYESATKSGDQPEDFQAIFRSGKMMLKPEELSFLWDHSSPGQRRQLMRWRDYQNHPALTQAHEVVWEKMAAIERWRRVASNKSEADREARDVKLQDEELARALKELAAAEAVLEQTAADLGLGWSDGEAEMPEPSKPTGVTIPAQPGRKQSNGRDFRAADAPLLADMAAAIKAAAIEGKRLSPEDAARLFVKKAVGAGTPASKVARLAKHFRGSTGLSAEIRVSPGLNCQD
jgi:hypothetical protein